MREICGASRMKIVICPGIHRSQLSQNFVAALHPRQEVLIFPAEKTPAYSPLHLLEFLSTTEATTPLIFIAFSAGVVAAIGAARLWQKQGGSVSAMIALDGWGVPLAGDFAIHRVSHDRFTAWSSALLGGGDSDSFYADPAVDHLTLWRSPQTVQGYEITANRRSPQTYTTATSFITALLQRYNPSTSARY